MEPEGYKISHADRLYARKPHETPQAISSIEEAEMAREEELEAMARDNLDRLYPHNPRNDELAKRLAGIIDTERTRRNAHYYRYRAMLRIANNEPIFTEDTNNIVEASLSDFHTRVSSLDDQGFEFARTLGGKGISAELAHVDQFGDWQAGKILDETIRALPHSPVLVSDGFLFGDTYDSKENARINYKFHLAAPLGRSNGISIKGVRKRAAADIVTEDGSVFEVVKQSSYLIDVRTLTDEQRATLGRTLRLQGAYDTANEQHLDTKTIHLLGEQLDNAMAHTGRNVIEPFVSDSDRRIGSTAVLAATSLYFALYRHQ